MIHTEAQLDTPPWRVYLYIPIYTIYQDTNGSRHAMQTRHKHFCTELQILILQQYITFSHTHDICTEIRKFLVGIYRISGLFSYPVSDRILCTIRIMILACTFLFFNISILSFMHFLNQTVSLQKGDIPILGNRYRHPVHPRTEVGQIVNYRTNK